MSDERAEKMKESLERLLRAPGDEPITIDKDHDLPIYDDASSRPYGEQEQHEDRTDSKARSPQPPE